LVGVQGGRFDLNLNEPALVTKIRIYIADMPAWRYQIKAARISLSGSVTRQVQLEGVYWNDTLKIGRVEGVGWKEINIGPAFTSSISVQITDVVGKSTNLGIVVIEAEAYGYQ
jgi:hypothetical protein